MDGNFPFAGHASIVPFNGHHYGRSWRERGGFEPLGEVRYLSIGRGGGTRPRSFWVTAGPAAGVTVYLRRSRTTKDSRRACVLQCIRAKSFILRSCSREQLSISLSADDHRRDGRGHRSRVEYNPLSACLYARPPNVVVRLKCSGRS